MCPQVVRHPLVVWTHAVLQPHRAFSNSYPQKSDADGFVKGREGLTVVATTMDEVYYPLIAKKQKMGAFVQGIAGKSDQTARYLLTGSEGEIKRTPADWQASHSDDFPLFRVQNLAFTREEGLEIPLFIRQDDALSAYKRLKEQKGTVPGKLNSEGPEVQVTSMLDLIGLFSQGGFESRALEIYPSMDAITAAKDILID